MPRFFTENINATGGEISGEDARHIGKSLRCKVGDELVVCNGQGQDFICSITDISPEMVTVKTLDVRESNSELPSKITLYQAMPKGDKLDLIIQKSVELGVYEIVPIITKYCVSRPDDKTMAKKIARLEKIAVEAAKQSGRSVIPKISPMLSFSDSIADSSRHSANIFFYEKATGNIGDLLAGKPDSVGVFIGSEGGFSEQEVEAIKTANIPVCSMGNRILRCETAAIAAVANIGFILEM